MFYGMIGEKWRCIIIQLEFDYQWGWIPFICFLYDFFGQFIIHISACFSFLCLSFFISMQCLLRQTLPVLYHGKVFPSVIYI